jgi:hypothetical protein
MVNDEDCTSWSHHSLVDVPKKKKERRKNRNAFVFSIPSPKSLLLDNGMLLVTEEYLLILRTGG